MHAEETTKTKGLRDFMQELIALGLITSSVSIVWSMVEIKKVIERSRAVENQIVTITSATTALADRATTRLEEFEQLRSDSIPDMGFREPPPGVIRPEEMVEESVTEDEPLSIPRTPQ